ncbi:hypothetical protein B0H13DRAFT_2658603 [Mycena leptocephala]|nr:hypothetical protein B0H13DRAFT_2658603 [Mycena leptocephala]
MYRWVDSASLPSTLPQILTAVCLLKGTFRFSFFVFSSSVPRYMRQIQEYLVTYNLCYAYLFFPHPPSLSYRYLLVLTSLSISVSSLCISGRGTGHNAGPSVPPSPSPSPSSPPPASLTSSRPIPILIADPFTWLVGPSYRMLPPYLEMLLSYSYSPFGVIWAVTMTSIQIFCSRSSTHLYSRCWIIDDVGSRWDKLILIRQ